MNLRKAISPVVATVLLIIISVGLAALLYAWATGWLGGATQNAAAAPKANIVIDTASLIKLVGGIEVEAYVRNIGGTSVTVNALYLKFPNGTVEKTDFESATIEPGKVKMISGKIWGKTLESGKAYVVIVVAIDGSRAEYSLVAP